MGNLFLSKGGLGSYGIAEVIGLLGFWLQVRMLMILLFWILWCDGSFLVFVFGRGLGEMGFVY